MKSAVKNINGLINLVWFSNKDPLCDWLVSSINERNLVMFNWKPFSRNHLKTHNAENEVTCDICKKVFPHAYALEGHKNRIHVQPENYRFQCPENNCNLKFRRKENVEAHLVHDHGRDRKVSSFGTCRRYNFMFSIFASGVLRNLFRKFIWVDISKIFIRWVFNWSEMSLFDPNGKLIDVKTI